MAQSVAHDAAHAYGAARVAGAAHDADAYVAALVGVSDTRDKTLQARLDGWREGHAAGYAEGAEAGRAQASAELLAEIDEEKRLRSSILAALSAAAPPPARWFLYCKPCRRLGARRPGCRDCQQRTRETFADPMPGEYLGGPVAWRPGAVPGSGEYPLEAAS